MHTYYIGTNDPSWCEYATMPLMISIDRILRQRSNPYKNAVTDVFLDSNAFNKLRLTGKWDRTPNDHIDLVKRCIEIVPTIKYVSPMDYMCEPFIVNKTGLTTHKHIELTVNNYVKLCELAPSIPWIPVIQGFTVNDYLYCLELYDKARVKLDYAGVGSVCRRQATDDILEVIAVIHSFKISIHAFGVKVLGLNNYSALIASADSAAWSIDARYKPPLTGCTHRNCANCYKAALLWYNNYAKPLIVDRS